MIATDRSPTRIVAQLTTRDVNQELLDTLPPEYRELADFLLGIPIADRDEEFFLFCRTGDGSPHPTRWPLFVKIRQLLNTPPPPVPPRPKPVVYLSERGTCLGEAIRWLESGYRPIPLCSANAPEPKKPYGEAWQTRIWTSAELRQFYKEHPDAGVGLLLGDVIDIDIDNWELAVPVLRRIWPDLDMDQWVNGLPSGLPQTMSFTSSICNVTSWPKIHLLFKSDPRLTVFEKSVIKGTIDEDGKVRGNKYYLGLEIRLGLTGAQQSVIPPTNIGYPRKWNQADGKALKLKPLPVELLVDLWFYHDPDLADLVEEHTRACLEGHEVPIPKRKKGFKAVSKKWKGAKLGYGQPRRYITKETIRRVARAIDLPALIEQYTGDDVHGGGMMCCVAHDDSRPSMSIFQADNGTWRFRCFSCGEHGDAVDFVAGMEGITVFEATDKLWQGYRPTATSISVRPAIWQDMAWQAAVDDLIRGCAVKLQGAPYARQHLRDRGLTDATIERFKLGWCMGGNKKEHGFSFPRGITIPMLLPGHTFDEQLGTSPLWAGFMIRSLSKSAGTGNSPKYLTVGVRGWGYPFADARPGVPALVLEGEFDALLAHQTLADVCHPITFGGTQCRPRSTAGIDQCDPWWICFDQDEAGAFAAAKWVRQFPKAQTLMLPRVNWNYVKDFTQYIVAGGDPKRLLPATTT